MNRETVLMNQIRVELSKTCVIFRANVGSVRMMDGRYFSTGLPKGFPDLFGFRKISVLYLWKSRQIQDVLEKNRKSLLQE